MCLLKGEVSVFAVSFIVKFIFPAHTISIFTNHLRDAPIYFVEASFNLTEALIYFVDALILDTVGSSMNQVVSSNNAVGSSVNQVVSFNNTIASSMN